MHAPEAILSEVPDRVDESDWFRGARCKVHLDMHCPEWDPSILSAFDADAIVRRVRETGSRCVYFFAKDHYGNAYFNTTTGHKSRVIGERDLLAEMIEAGKRHGVYIIAYVSVVWDIYAGKAHPEWLQRDAQGRSIPEYPDPKNLTRWLTLCHNSGYMDELGAMLQEIAGNYEVDGFHLDMFHMAFADVACYCDTCLRLFQEETGQLPPRTPTWDPLWRKFLEFRFTSVAHAMERMVGAVQDVRPGLFVTTNYHGSPGFDWRAGQRPVQHAQAGTMNTGETYTPAFGDMYPGMEARFLRGLDPDKAFELVCWRMNRITDFTNKPLPQFRWEALTALAHGASIMVIDQPFHDGGLDDVAYDRMGEVFSEVAAKERTFAGTPLGHVGLCYSVKSRDWYAREHPGRYQMAVAGAYKALTESHLATDFLFDESLSAEKLAAFPVVYLANAAILSEQESRLFEEYVAQGGYLVATFDTSLYDEDGNRLEDFRLGHVFGVSLDRTVENYWHFWRDMPAPYGTGIDPRYYVLNTGDCHVVRPLTAKGCGNLHACLSRREPPDHFFSHAVHPPHQRIGPAFFLNEFGDGKAVYIPHPIDSAYAGPHELPEHRMLIRNAVRAAGYRPLVDVVEAGINTEVVARHDGQEVYIHILNFNPTRQSTALDGWDNPIRPSIRMDEPPYTRTVLDVSQAFETAGAWDSRTEIKRDGNRIAIAMHDVHEVVTITLA